FDPDDLALQQGQRRTLRSADEDGLRSGLVELVQRGRQLRLTVAGGPPVPDRLLMGNLHEGDAALERRLGLLTRQIRDDLSSVVPQVGGAGPRPPPRRGARGGGAGGA